MGNVAIYISENKGEKTEFGIFDYVGFLELKLKISKLELIILKDVRELFIFDNNTFYPIDFYGNCDFNPFKKVDELLHSINHNQLVLRQIIFMKRKG